MAELYDARFNKDSDYAQRIANMLAFPELERFTKVKLPNKRRRPTY